MLVSSFIKGPLIEEIKKMTINDNGEAEHAYLGFILIASSIEFLGACLDAYDWDDSGLSEKRFRLAIRELFPQNYHIYNKKGHKFDLYSNLRCSMVHSSRPGNCIGLSQKKHGCNKSLLEDEKGKRLIICFEYFFEDFIEACKLLLKKIKNKEINYQKVYQNILSVPEDKNIF